MRMVVISQSTDLNRLRKTLFTGAADTSAALERVKALNPHVDLRHVAAGTVLLLPDSPSVSATHSSSIGGDAFSEFAADVTNGLKNAAQRARAGTESLAADRTAVAAVLRVAAVKRIVGSDATLAKQLDTASARFTAGQKEAQEAAATLATLTAQTKKELAALAKLLG
jgi:hypothetical protein